jgi:hypothetical protein
MSTLLDDHKHTIAFIYCSIYLTCSGEASTGWQNSGSTDSLFGATMYEKHDPCYTVVVCDVLQVTC